MMNHHCLLTGQIKPLGNGQILSAIGKTIEKNPLYLTKTGFQTDQQADLRYHGGFEKAVHHYHYGHYNFWLKELGEKALLQQPGAFGENISTVNMDEKDVAVGDRFQLGEAIIEVSQGRQPCSKLNLVFGQKDMAKKVQNTGLSGWYYRVLKEGNVLPQDHPILIARQAEEWTIHELWKVLYVDKYNWDTLKDMVRLQFLSENWRVLAQKRLNSRKIEDWSKRLNGDVANDGDI